MIGIIVALECEAEKVIEKFENGTHFLLCGKKAVKGRLYGQEAVLVISGVGKVNAALSTQAVIDNYSPRVALNFGTAGGANHSVEVFGYYLIDGACQYDFDITAIEDVPIGYISAFDTVFFRTHTENLQFFKRAKLATADRFSNKSEDISTVNALGCSLRDMEGGAIAQVCAANGVPLIMIKGVTDIYDKPAKQYHENNKIVCSGFPDAVEKIMNALKDTDNNLSSRAEPLNQ